MLEKCCNWILWSKSWREIDRKSIEAGNCFNFLPLTPPRPPQRGAAAAAFSLSRVPLKLDQIRTLFLLKFLFFSFQFKRMLNKELSHFSESKSGNQISEYICSTFLGKNWHRKFIIRKEESSWEPSGDVLQKWIFCIRTVIVICTKTHVSLQLTSLWTTDWWFSQKDHQLYKPQSAMIYNNKDPTIHGLLYIEIFNVPNIAVLILFVFLEAQCCSLTIKRPLIKQEFVEERRKTKFIWSPFSPAAFGSP